ncbi:hypothetical protein FTG_1440 [Francisella tularensis subsp. novicida FTG]|nr:hypothetical protein FTG_1440 [Francisella tularensis subsp. novicida FTG]
MRSNSSLPNNSATETKQDSQTDFKASFLTVVYQIIQQLKRSI